MAKPLRTLLGTVALALGISLSVGVASASATPVSFRQSSSTQSVLGQTGGPCVPRDWWW